MSTDTAIQSLKEKIDDLNQQAWEARVNNTQKTFESGQESLKLARSINYTKGIAEATKTLGFYYARLAKNDEAQPLLKESLSLFESLNDLRGQAVVYEYLAIVQRSWGNLGVSLEFLFKALELSQRTGFRENEAFNHYQLGVTYKHLGNFEKALDHLYKSLSAHRETNNKLYQSYPITIIGSIYFENGDFTQALKYYKEGLISRQESNDKLGEAGSLDNIGFTYLKLKDYPQAIEYCAKSLSINEITGDKRGQSNALLHLAEAYKQTADVEKATKFSNESLEIKKATGDKKGEAEIFLFLADLHKAQPENDNNIFEWLNNALKIAEEIRALDLLSKTRFHLYEYYKQKGNFEEAIKNLDLHTNLEKEFHKNTIDQKVSNLEISHKAEVISQRNKELTELNEQIEKANADLKIEASLERVRAVAMGMKEPAEMLKVCRTISDQLLQLGFENIRNVQTVIIYQQKHEHLNYQYFVPYDKDLIEVIDYWLHPDVLNFTNQMLASTDAYYTKTFEGKELKDWREYRKQTNQLPDPKLDEAASSHYYFYSIGSGALGVTTYAPLSEKEIGLFKRFRNVFELAYRRFVDIEKAEAQAREAKIEVALERTRTQSMLMQHSKELDDTLRVFHQQVLLLGINSAFSFLWLPDEKNDRHIFWATWAENVSNDPLANKDATVFKSKAINYPLDRNEPATAQCLVDWKGKEPVVSYHVPPAGVESYFAAWQELISGVEQLKPEYFSNGLNYVEAFMKYGCFGVMVATDLTKDEKKILSRFANEFERTYTRFLDLQKAEAQAREAQIEAGLERVRSRSLAMHNTSELQEVIHAVHKELLNLNIAIHGGSFIAINRDVDTVLRCWGSGGTADTSEEVYLPLYEHPFCTNLISRIKSAPGFFTEEYTQKEKKDFFTFLFEHEPWSKLDAKQKNETLSSPGGYTRSCYVSKHTSIFIINHFGKKFSAADNDILQRFGKVFEQTYTRFLDLQKAESQTREALIEGALERVRARALAMQQPEELKDVAQVLRNEMGALGVEELETCSIYIHGDSSENVECWYALQDPKHTEKKMVSDHFVLNLDDTWVGREMKKFYGSGEKQTSIVMQGINRKEWINYCYEHSPVFSGFYGETIPDRTYHLYKFSHGYIGAAAPGDISGESWKLLGRAASVFSLAYSRFKDLTQARNDLIKLKQEKKRAEDALTELQATQKQLIQTEKMASLGELTAGIAHEIQNPLNFVNNFSDVSNELLEEMKAELEKGNAEEAKAIAVDVKENLEKILHHGKRADAIVKGMLQHSRNNSGQKELTDINVLAEEYLRLAYHGLRAKDKFFNAKFETDLDPAINKINIVPQEIGRVILNLINNSFYAVSEKKKNVSNGYEPSVMVSTKKINDKVEIRVKDNGNGIPQKVLDKIFQPFFTTKPTGQGTGLGLSLSYDIITKGHDGEIKVETKEGEGSAFIISLPMK